MDRTQMSEGVENIAGMKNIMEMTRDSISRLGIDIEGFRTKMVNSEDDIATIEEDMILIIRPGLKIDIHSSVKRSVLVVGEGATIRYLTISDGTNKKIAILEKDAEMVWIDAMIPNPPGERSSNVLLNDKSSSGASKGGSVCENITILAGTGAKAGISSSFLGMDDECYDIKMSVAHIADRTSSSMLTRAALMGNSTGRYEGHVRIYPGAKGCEAHQREDTLLLGDKTSMEAKPILEIENNDVRCSHGVALGRIDDEKIFYLESRGISRNDAQRVIVEGFFDPLLISMGEYGKKVRNDIISRLGSAERASTTESDLMKRAL